MATASNVRNAQHRESSLTVSRASSSGVHINGDTYGARGSISGRSQSSGVGLGSACDGKRLSEAPPKSPTTGTWRAAHASGLLTRASC